MEVIALRLLRERKVKRARERERERELAEGFVVALGPECPDQALGTSGKIITENTPTLKFGFRATTNFACIVQFYVYNTLAAAAIACGSARLAGRLSSNAFYT